MNRSSPTSARSHGELSSALLPGRAGLLGSSCELQRGSERALSAVLFKEAGDGAVESLPVSLAGQGTDDVAFWIDQDQGRPGSDRVGIPDLVIAVHGHRVRHVVAPDCPPDILGVFLLAELARMHADDHERPVSVLLLQVLEVGQHVHAVDATVGPEVQQHDLPGQFVDAQGAVDVKPLGRPGEIRGPHRRVAAPLSLGPKHRCSGVKCDRLDHRGVWASRPRPGPPMTGRARSRFRRAGMIGRRPDSRPAQLPEVPC
jgi:hypothetical protein